MKMGYLDQKNLMKHYLRIALAAVMPDNTTGITPWLG
jgi:hypothetical protein